MVVRTLASTREGEITAKRSRFVAVVAPATTIGQAEQVWAAQRRSQHQARHHCVAWRLGLNPAETGAERAGDDGEPAGTAGPPMLEVLRGRGLTDVVAVVSRYFGGVKLGTGGLTRAYAGAVEQALVAAPLLTLVPVQDWQLHLSLTDAEPVAAGVRRAGHQVRVRYDSSGGAATLLIRTESLISTESPMAAPATQSAVVSAAQSDRADELTALVQELTRGAGRLERVGVAVRRVAQS